MSTGKTTYLELHRWEPDDDFLRAEFNENSDKLDSALQDVRETLDEGLSAAARIRTGSYTGTGTSGAGDPNSITFPFTPRFVIVIRGGGAGMTYSTGAFFAWLNGTFVIGNADNATNFPAFSLNGSTLSWYHSGQNSQYNMSGVVYHYIALA